MRHFGLIAGVATSARHARPCKEAGVKFQLSGSTCSIYFRHRNEGCRLRINVHISDKNFKNPDETARTSDKSAAPRMSIRDAQKQMTRERLLDAAFELFKESGYRNVTIDQIMKRASANRATFYLHFKDKLEVAWALGQRQAGSKSTKLYHELESLDQPSLKELRKWVERRIAFLGEDAPLSHVMNEAITSEARFAEEYGAYLGRVADVILVKTLKRRSAKRHSVARSKFIALILMMDRYALHAQHQGLAFQGEFAVDAITEMLWDALYREQANSAES